MIYTAYITKADKDLIQLYKKVGRNKFRKLMRLSLLSLSDPSQKLMLIQCYEFDVNEPEEALTNNVVRICMKGKKWESIRIFFEKAKDHSSFMKTIFRLMLGPKVLIPLFAPSEDFSMQETQSLMIGSATTPVTKKRKTVHKKKLSQKPKATKKPKETLENKEPLKITVLPTPVQNEVHKPSYQSFSMEDEFKEEKHENDTDILSMLNNLFG